MKNSTLIILVVLVCIGAASCSRKTSTSNGSDTKSDVYTNNESPLNITESDPFKNQPNELCTVIRKLTIAQYDHDASLKVTDLSAYPEKYCLLDVCLDSISNTDRVINLGDSTESVNSNYALIKVFETVDDAKAYASAHHITDAVFQP
jgi:hypothetical protein